MLFCQKFYFPLGLMNSLTKETTPYSQINNFNFFELISIYSHFKKRNTSDEEVTAYTPPDWAYLYPDLSSTEKSLLNLEPQQGKGPGKYIHPMGKTSD